jgi:hypothetical protein
MEVLEHGGMPLVVDLYRERENVLRFRGRDAS